MVTETDRQLDTAAVAALLGVQTQSIRSYRSRVRSRDRFPGPDGYLGHSPWWWETTIRRWMLRGKWAPTRENMGSP